MKLRNLTQTRSNKKTRDAVSGLLPQTPRQTQNRRAALRRSTVSFHSQIPTGEKFASKSTKLGTEKS